MTTFYTPIQPLIPGVAWEGYTALVSQADTDIFQVAVTLEAGDVKLSKDGAAAVDLTNLPVETGSTGLLVIQLTELETTGITKFATILFHDQNGLEWQDQAIVIPVVQAVTFSSGVVPGTIYNTPATVAFTLSEICYRVARELGITIEGIATNGSLTTITDNINLKDIYNDDHFNGGTAWIIWDSLGTGVAPQGEMHRITDFKKSTGQVTTETFSASPANGDRYALAPKRYTRDMIVMSINRVLAEQPCPYVDSTTIQTEDDKTEYPLPLGVLDQTIEVWIALHDDSGDRHWHRSHDFYVQDTPAGTAKTLVFHYQPFASYDLRIKYWLPHPPIYADNDVIYETIDINRVVLGAAYYLLLWEKSQKTVVDPTINERLAELASRYENVKWQHPAKKPRIKLAAYGHIDNIEDTYDYDYGY